MDITKIIMMNGSLMKVKILQNAPRGSLCNASDLHKAITGLKIPTFCFLKVAVLQDSAV